MKISATRVSMMRILPGFKIRKKIDAKTFMEKCMTNGGEYIIKINPNNAIVFSKRSGEDFSVYNKHGDLDDIFTVNGEKCNVSSLTVGTTGWKVVIVVPNAELMSTVYKTAVFYVVLIVVSMVIILLVTILYMKKSLQPVLKVNSFMADVADGVLSAQIESKDKTELGQMTRSVNHSVGNIRDMVGQIIHISGDLETSADENN